MVRNVVEWNDKASKQVYSCRKDFGSNNKISKISFVQQK